MFLSLFPFILFFPLLSCINLVSEPNFDPSFPHNHTQKKKPIKQTNRINQSLPHHNSAKPPPSNQHPRRTIIINRRPNNTYHRPSPNIFRVARQTTVSPPPKGYPVRNQPLHDVGLDLTVLQHLSRPPRSTGLDLMIPAPIASHLAPPLTS